MRFLNFLSGEHSMFQREAVFGVGKRVVCRGAFVGMSDLNGKGNFALLMGVEGF